MMQKTIPCNESYIFYYGTDIPDVLKTRALSNKSVILQNYHPLVQSRQYSLFFPNLTRFVYWNMSRIHQNDYIAAEQTMHLPIIGRDPQWNTIILDLNHRVCVEYVIQKALKILSDPQVDGLFVDDLDTWSDQPEKIDLGVACLREIADRSKQNVKWILNRGFSYWHQIPNLKAVVLESITPATLYKVQNEAQNFAWLKNIYQLYFRPFKLAFPETHILGMTYDPQELEISKRELEQASSDFAQSFNAIFDELIFLPYHINEWPQEFVSSDFSGK